MLCEAIIKSVVRHHEEEIIQQYGQTKSPVAYTIVYTHRLKHLYVHTHSWRYFKMLTENGVKNKLILVQKNSRDLDILSVFIIHILMNLLKSCSHTHIKLHHMSGGFFKNGMEKICYPHKWNKKDPINTTAKKWLRDGATERHPPQH